MEVPTLSIKDWAIDDRPREKLLNKGVGSLSDAELVAILIGSGNRNETAVQLSQRILQRNANNLNELGKQSIVDLMKFKGIGEAKAISITAALELGKRRSLHAPEFREKIQSSTQVAKLMSPILSDLPHEEFWAVFLNRGNKVIEKSCISIGGVSGTVVDIRLVFKPAIEKLASAVILCHNHPSGNKQASKADIDLTKKLIEAGKYMDIPVLDHVIIAGDSYLSLADEGLM